MRTDVSMKGGRDRRIDFIKGMGILLMVYRHARGPASDFVLLFHMAIFFMASGWLLNTKYAGDGTQMKKYIGKKLRGLWVPYVCFNTLFVICNNIFLRLNIYTDNPMFLKADGIEREYAHLGTHYDLSRMLKEIIKVLCFQGGTELGGALWFFNALFFVLVLYMVIQYILERMLRREMFVEVAQAVIAVCFLVCGYLCYRKGIYAYGMNRVLSYYILVYAGHICRKWDVLDGVFRKLHPAVVTLLAAAVLLALYHRGSINLAGNAYTNPGYLLVASFAGWTMLFGIGTMAGELKKSRVLDGIQYISIHAVPIIGLHFLCFKAVSLMAVGFYGMKPYMLAAFPVLMTTEWWWIGYVAVGIAVPLVMDWGWRRLIHWQTRRSV